MGADVVDLDARAPFTAARARNAGFEQLLRIKPELRYVQFVDGDCELQPGWINAATSCLDRTPEVAAVFGRLRERHPERSLYNWLCDQEWDGPIGETKYCGGIVIKTGLALVLIYPAQLLRRVVRLRGTWRERLDKAFFELLGRFPETIGQINFLRDRLLGQQSKIIEHKVATR
jgi:hypothetical protein